MAFDYSRVEVLAHIRGLPARDDLASAGPVARHNQIVLSALYSIKG